MPAKARPRPTATASAWAGTANGLNRDCIARCGRPGRTKNLRSLASQVRSGLFFAHVRASTGTATTRANCHPFSAGPMMFMHNGQVGEWARVRRRVESLIPDGLYDERTGTTDSEAIFLAALARGLQQDPTGAITETLAEVHAIMAAAGVKAALRFTAALTDGKNLWAFRWGVRQPPGHAILAAGCSRAGRGVRTDRRRGGWLEFGAVRLLPGVGTGAGGAVAADGVPGAGGLARLRPVIALDHHDVGGRDVLPQGDCLGVFRRLVAGERRCVVGEFDHDPA